jgi:hypothetical protein
MEASDGEEEKSQEGSEEKEEVDRRSRWKTRRPPEGNAVEKRRAGKSAGKAAAKPAAPMTETAVRLPSVKVAPGAGPAPNPAAAWSFP